MFQLGDLLAGFSHRTLKKPHELIGDGLTSRHCVGINDPLMVHSLVLEGNAKRIAIVAVDLLAIDLVAVDRIRTGIASLGLRADDVLVAASHTHCAPPAIDFGHTKKDEDVVADIVDKSIESVSESAQSLSRATLRMGATEFPHNVNRRQRTWLGRTRLGVNPEGPVDAQLSYLLLKNAQGRLLLLCYGCHPVINKTIPLASADYVSGVRLAAASVGITALFLNGALGDVVPYDTQRRVALGTAGPEVANEFGRRMADQALASSSSDRDESELPIRSASAICEVRMTKLNGEQSTRRLPVQALGIGQLIFVGFPGEVFAQTSLELRSSLSTTNVVSCANDYVGYLPRREDYARGGYEIKYAPQNLGYGATAGTAEELEKEARELSSQLLGN